MEPNEARLVRLPLSLDCPLEEAMDKAGSPLMSGMLLLPFITLRVSVMSSRNKLEGNCTAATEKMYQVLE